MASRPGGNQTGSISAQDPEGGRRKGIGWLPWLLLLAGIAALAIFLLLRNAGDDNDDPGIDVEDDGSNAGAGEDEDSDAGEIADSSQGDTEAEGSETETETDDPSTTTPTTAPIGGTGTAAGSPLVSGEDTLLGLPATGLTQYAGQPAVATGVPVESVVADEGFWVGNSPTDRVFVSYAGEDEAGNLEEGVQIEVGQRLSFNGTVVPLPADVEEVGDVDESEGLAQLQEQGHLIQVDPTTIQGA